MHIDMLFNYRAGIMSFYIPLIIVNKNYKLNYKQLI